ncbi:deoxyribonuclease IV [Thermodesulfovibrionales bacterium]|nr:deoxyribonuclease IV [Thermodesulfovibrionales bacterium]MCL0034088.1 deoxyribonuclease IV [Thermodesulfovibrionales bacterium]MCL0061910.1 deoxyribonuclease IV [Thermodesulfovibrionales bacterium]
MVAVPIIFYKRRRLGVHTSIAGGIHLSLERAKRLGCNTIQIFSHNPRQWFVGKIPSGLISEFKELRKAYDISPVFIHTSYLINLASFKEDNIKKSIQLLIQEMDIADALDADYVILHTGSASQETEGAAHKKAIETLKMALKEERWKAKLLLENTAGERGDVSSRIKDIAEIIDRTDSPMIEGVCIDSCHAFAAGYDLRVEEGLAELIKEIEDFLGLDKVRLLHLNDSKKGINSRLDRHEHIGSGNIGEEGLWRFINHHAFKDIPLILETPKKSDEDDTRNIKVVKRLIETG